jgi:hypothetical protein
MSEIRTLSEDWIDILPDLLSLSAGESPSPKAKTPSPTLPGDILVFEWRVENDQAVPGAWITLDTADRAISRLHCGWNGMFGEELLTPNQRTAFLRGEVPRLEWPVEFDCPVTLRLDDSFDLTIERLERVKKAGFEARYKPERLTIRDLRPEPMLRAGALPSVNYSKGHDDAIHGPTSAEIERAAHESAYTRDPSRSADKHASAILPDEVGAVSRYEVLRAGKRDEIKEVAEENRGRHPWRQAA